MSTTIVFPPRVQRPFVFAALALATGLSIHLQAIGNKLSLLLLVGLMMGVVLYHAALGFTGAYRRAIQDRDFSGVDAQLIMLGVAMVLFTPVLAEGQAFGQSVVGAVAPVSISMAFGAFLFGIGMQLAGGCGSGTLFGLGSGNLRMVVVLIFFCIGGFWASLHLGWWARLPGIGAISLGQILGWGPALTLQLAVLAAIHVALRWNQRTSGAMRPPNSHVRFNLLRGPWPLLLGAGLLAVLNWATLVTAGHPWSITWGFTLWGAKAAVALGWDATGSGFWSGGFPGHALRSPVLADATSVMNIGIVIGAFAAASLAGVVRPSARISLRSIASAVLGGLLLGYGARLAYGCNIGAFFSGVASSSLHGWVWILMAFPGNWLGVRLRSAFRQ